MKDLAQFASSVRSVFSQVISQVKSSSKDKALTLRVTLLVTSLHYPLLLTMSSRGYIKFLRHIVSSKLNWQKLAWESQERVITAERKLREIQHVCHGTGTSMQRLTLSAPTRR